MPIKLPAIWSIRSSFLILERGMRARKTLSSFQKNVYQNRVQKVLKIKFRSSKFRAAYRKIIKIYIHFDTIANVLTKRSLFYSAWFCFSSIIRDVLSVADGLLHGSSAQQDVINSIHSVGGTLPLSRRFSRSISRDTSSVLMQLRREDALLPNHISHIIIPKLCMSAFES